MDLFQQALHGRKKKHGRDHPSTLATAHNLAQVYQNMGRYTDAKELYNQVLRFVRGS
jgi:tetratricopeptide (TPR) repeat protein